MIFRRPKHSRPDTNETVIPSCFANAHAAYSRPKTNGRFPRLRPAIPEQAHCIFLPNQDDRPHQALPIQIRTLPYTATVRPSSCGTNCNIRGTLTSASSYPSVSIHTGRLKTQLRFSDGLFKALRFLFQCRIQNAAQHKTGSRRQQPTQADMVERQHIVDC